jgi:sugar/nucleoside kinase (ribokinase family)
MLVCSLGDLLLDVVVRPDRGLVTGSDVSARTRVTVGGQAANVAAWVVALGGSARFIGKRADDEGSRVAVSALERCGVEVLGPVVGGDSGIVVSLVAANGERTMASFRGVADELSVDEIDAEWLACDHLHVSGYALADEPMRTAALSATALSRERGARVSVDLAATTVVDAVGMPELRNLLDRLDPDVVLCNEDEDEAIGGRLDGRVWIVKRGARGATIDGTHYPAEPVEDVVDATGAGDAFAAGWIVGGVELALHAAALCVAQVGAFPAAHGPGGTRPLQS